MSSIVAHPDFKSTNFSSVRMMVNIGPHDLLRRFAQALPHVLQVSCYGLTESSGICCVTDLTDTPEDRIVTAGRPFHGSEIKIVNPDTLNDAEIGSLGEIWVRGDAVFCGYYKDPDLTAITITPDGWLRTGDLGELARGGRLIFKGRLKDMLKIGGENVAAAEIENFLMRHEGVKMAQVIPVADERLVEVAAAFVELMPGVLLTELDVADYCAERIASFKVPRYVKFVTDWPMGATKIAKHLLPRDFENRSALDVTEIIRRKRQAAQTARAGR
jgi:fatty-acyl-CoA synthase